MEPSTTTRLIELNRQFYTVFGPAFAATRRRIQEGVRRALGSLPIQGGTWLDVGCGSGSLAVEWLRLTYQPPTWASISALPSWQKPSSPSYLCLAMRKRGFLSPR